jgi:hypothetical protein
MAFPIANQGLTTFFLIDHFLHLAGLRFAPRVLLDMALHILNTLEEQFMNRTLNPADGLPIIKKITHSFI